MPNLVPPVTTVMAGAYRERILAIMPMVIGLHLDDCVFDGRDRPDEVERGHGEGVLPLVFSRRVPQPILL